MFKFALKNMAIKKIQIILVVLSVVISAGVAILAYNIASQIDDGISSNAGYYSLIVGPAGSNTDLAMNSMYFTGNPTETIPYSYMDTLYKDTNVRRVIPLAIGGGTYKNQYKVVGTSADLLANKGFDSGNAFDDSTDCQVVVGYTVAQRNNLSVGDKIKIGHGTDAHGQDLEVVGILEQSYSSYDTVVFTQVKTLWHLHENEGEEHHDHNVYAFLINTNNLTGASTLIRKLNNTVIVDEESGTTYPIQAIEPMSIMRGVLDDLGDTKYITLVLCAIILAMNILVISIITLLNMYNSKKEISLMRLIGISMKKINLLYIIQNSIIGIISTLLAFGASRLCLLLMSGFAQKMGVVLNYGKFYPLEFVILLGVFIITVLPTIICTYSMARKDSLEQ
ncbi:MAG: ABC transporter permease [Clostridia bacterium]|nr:ABC transporter permease [Clostridia bacterium]